MGKQEDIRKKHTNETRARLQICLIKMRSNLSGDMPEKHQNNSKGYLRYIRREILLCEKKISVL